MTSKNSALLERMGIDSFDVLKNIPIPIIASNKKEKMHWLNDKARELFGDFTNYPYRNIYSEGIFQTCLLTIDNKECFYNIHISEDCGLSIHTLEDRTAEVELENQLGKDPLTGLNNRLYMEKIVSREMSRVSRSESGQLSVIMLDFDHFKVINDTYGHDVGDAARKELSVFIQQIIRDTDVPFRYGGEEFLILLPNTSANQAEMFAERIRQAIENHAFQCKLKGKFECTISGGIAQYGPGDSDPVAFIKKADQALYKSKEAGRNRVTVAK